MAALVLRAMVSRKPNVKLFDLENFDISTINNYNVVRFGSSVHGKIKNFGFVSNNWDILSKKKVAVLASTGSPTYNFKQQKAIEASLPAELYRNLRHFPLPVANN